LRTADGHREIPPEERDELNLAYLEMISGGNAALKDKIIQLLIDETPDELYNLRQVTREKNWKRVRAVAHKMKSGVTYLGLSKALERTKRIEEYAASETHLDKIPELVEKIAVACTKAINELVKIRNDRHAGVSR
jgi:HPt (histidine-containing phosphotransfer) domain-containing protein